MDDGVSPPVGWRSLADAVPGCVAIQSDDRFVHVSESASSTLGREAASLAGDSWRTLFEETTAERIEREVLPAARSTGRWDGEVRLADGPAGGGPIGVTVATAEDTIVWTFSGAVSTGQDERDRELKRYESIAQTLGDGVYAIDADRHFTYVNDALCEMTGRSREELLGASAIGMFAEESERAAADEEIERLLAADGEVTGTIEATFDTSAGIRNLESRFRLHPPADEEFRGSVGVIRDVTERERRERTLERQRDELETLDRINELLLETTRELVSTASREAVEETVCERLARSDLYQFAWVGEHELDGDGVVPRVSAGEGEGFLEAVESIRDGGGRPGRPTVRALESGTVQVSAVADLASDALREQAAARGFASVAAVPLSHGDAVYGVLSVYATRSGAFSEREQAGFDALGRSVGLVIHAARSRALLFADAVVELQFRVDGEDTPLLRAAASGCTLTLEGYVAAGDRWILYLAVTDASAGDVVDALAADEAVERARVIGEGQGGERIEVVVESASILHSVTDAGGTIRSARLGPDGGRVTVDVPADADVRDLVEHVTDGYADAALAARRERDREVTTTGRPGGLLAGLTDRQREALEVAYRAGYYDWPRESTAEDVARALDLASATLHGHLRKAERGVLSALLDD